MMTLFVEDIRCEYMQCLRPGTTPKNTGHVLTGTKHTHTFTHHLSHALLSKTHPIITQAYTSDHAKLTCNIRHKYVHR